jgi:hypothetical protein
MSAARILRRKAWKKAVKSEDVAASFHDHQIATGARNESFQRKQRKARADRGLRPTSTSMHWLDGSRVS